MASFVQLTNIASGASFTLGAGETGYIGRGVTVVGGGTFITATNTTGTAVLTNYGDIVAPGNSVRQESTGGFVVYNYGSVTALSGGNYPLSAGSASRFAVFNTGIVQGNVGVNSSLLFEVINTGTIFGDIVDFDFGSNSVFKLNNSGLISGSVTGSSNTAVAGDTISNSGGTILGNVFLRNGNDLFDGRGGRVDGVIDGGNGNDVIYGGDNADKITDLFGTNWIVGGGGGDTVTINSGDFLTDTIFAGEVNGADTSGDDTLIVSGGSGVNIFLGGQYVQSVTAGNPLVAWISAFENATGSFSADALIGDGKANILDGGDGADWLVGGGGIDTFRFSDWAFIDAGEQIADFDHDIIDLSRIDADFGVAGDQAFAFRTAHTNNTAAEVVMTSFGGAGAKLDFYVDANNSIDATLFVAFGSLTQPTLNAGDFIL